MVGPKVKSLSGGRKWDRGREEHSSLSDKEKTEQKEGRQRRREKEDYITSYTDLASLCSLKPLHNYRKTRMVVEQILLTAILKLHFSPTGLY